MNEMTSKRTPKRAGDPSAPTRAVLARLVAAMVIAATLGAFIITNRMPKGPEPYVPRIMAGRSKDDWNQLSTMNMTALRAVRFKKPGTAASPTTMPEDGTQPAPASAKGTTE